jgi:hypothetical protein
MLPPEDVSQSYQCVNLWFLLAALIDTSMALGLDAGGLGPPLQPDEHHAVALSAFVY